MNNGGDAAEQVVRLSLEGFEVAARLSGSAAKNIALLLVSVLKQEQKTKQSVKSRRLRKTARSRSRKTVRRYTVSRRRNPKQKRGNSL